MKKIAVFGTFFFEKAKVFFYYFSIRVTSSEAISDRKTLIIF